MSEKKPRKPKKEKEPKPAPPPPSEGELLRVDPNPRWTLHRARLVYSVLAEQLLAKKNAGMVRELQKYLEEPSAKNFVPLLAHREWRGRVRFLRELILFSQALASKAVQRPASSNGPKETTSP